MKNRDMEELYGIKDGDFYDIDFFPYGVIKKFGKVPSINKVFSQGMALGSLIGRIEHIGDNQIYIRNREGLFVLNFCQIFQMHPIGNCEVENEE